MIMIVKTPGSQMGSPAAAEGGEAMGGGRAFIHLHAHRENIRINTKHNA